MRRGYVAWRSRAPVAKVSGQSRRRCILNSSLRADEYRAILTKGAAGALGGPGSNVFVRNPERSAVVGFVPPRPASSVITA